MNKVTLQFKILGLTLVLILIPVIAANVIFSACKHMFAARNVITGTKSISSQLQAIGETPVLEDIQKMSLEEFQIKEEGGEETGETSETAPAASDAPPSDAAVEGEPAAGEEEAVVETVDGEPAAGEDNEKVASAASATGAASDTAAAAADATADAAVEEPAEGGEAAAPAPQKLSIEELKAAKQRLLDEAVQALVPGRPGVPDLYVVGFGGDSTEDVFRNETRYLDALMTRRFGAEGHVITLVNHDDSLIRTPRPLATKANLRAALKGVAKVMDRDEDVLLLFMTMHGTPQHLQAPVNGGALGTRTQLETPFSTTVVTQNDIKNAQPRKLGDLFVNDASVTDTSGSYSGWSSYLSIRGLPLDWRLLASGYLPEYLRDAGALTPGYALEALRACGRITQRAQAADGDAGFSGAIRRGVPGMGQP